MHLKTNQQDTGDMNDRQQTVNTKFSIVCIVEWNAIIRNSRYHQENGYAWETRSIMELYLVIYCASDWTTLVLHIMYCLFMKLALTLAHSACHMSKENGGIAFTLGAVCAFLAMCACFAWYSAWRTEAACSRRTMRNMIDAQRRKVKLHV